MKMRYFVTFSFISAALVIRLAVVEGFFTKENWLDGIRTNQKNYGVAVSDVNHDGNPDFIVAGYSGPNFVFTYDKDSGRVTNIAQEGTAFAALRDVPGNAIGRPKSNSK